jgi:hypothetical protein
MFVPLVVLGISIVFAIGQIIYPTEFEQQAVVSIPTVPVPTLAAIPAKAQVSHDSRVTAVTSTISPTIPVHTGLQHGVTLAATCSDCSRTKLFSISATVSQQNVSATHPIELLMTVPAHLDIAAIGGITNGSCQIVPVTGAKQVLCAMSVSTTTPVTMWVNTNISHMVEPGKQVLPEVTATVRDLQTNTITSRGSLTITANP